MTELARIRPENFFSDRFNLTGSLLERVLDAPEEIRAEHTFEQATGQVETVGKEVLGPYASKLSH